MTPRHTIPAVEKTLRLLQLLAEDGEAASAPQLARELGISPSTTYRILQTLVAQDWLQPVAGGRFAFSSGIFPLLQPLADYQSLFEHLKFPLAQLVETTALTAKISIKQGTEAITVYRMESPRGLSPSSKVGARFHLAYGSSGACLLAGWEDAEIRAALAAAPAPVWRLQEPEDVWRRIRAARKAGSCYDPGQFQTPVHGVSAPVFGRDGGIFAALTLVGWAEDFKGARQRQLEAAVRDCAARCSAQLARREAA